MPMDIEMILNNPMSLRRQPDFWARHYEKTCVFSVRSAYRMLVHNLEDKTAWLEAQAGRSSTKAEEKEWVQFWNVQVPSKLRVFLWRLARHLIANGDILHHRNMAVRSSCTLCGMRHSLMDCNMKRCVWALEKEEAVELLCQVPFDDAHGWLT